ncbi:hypothetical protein ACROYT_G000518 [Oculina patagonica]
MADGPRFPMSGFRPQNHHISGPFTGGNSPIPAKYPSMPPETFLPQSNQLSTNSVQGHLPQMFARNQGHDIMHHNKQSFPPSFHQNNSNFQQDKHPMAVQMPEVQRHPFPAGQFITNRQTTHSSPNSHSFSSHAQLPFPPSNTSINMDSSIAGMTHSSSPFPTGTPQLLQSTLLQATSHVPLSNEQSSSMTFPESFPAPFSGPISGLPVAAPMQFPPPFPSTPPTVHLAAPPVIQPPNVPGLRAQETTGQERINNFLKERGIEKQGKQTSEKTNLKLHTAKEFMTDWLQLISEMSIQRDKLAELASSQNESEWRQELEKAKKLQARINQIQAYFSSPEKMKQLEEQVTKRKRKREWQKRRRKEEYILRQEAEERKTTLHKKIDEWRSKIIAEDEAKRKAESMKHEAGGVLGEVKRKQTDATKAVELLKALRKLREARKQEAEVKGVYVKPTVEENRRFEERVKWLENVMEPRRELYEAEEKTLRVMLAEEEEEKEKERREMERRNQASLGLSDPMDWFHSYYKQAEHSMQSLVQIRRQWDAFLAPETFPGASRIPEGYVTPAEPSSSLWATAVIDKG